MIGSQQARIIGLLRMEFEKDSQTFLTIKEIHAKYFEKYPDSKQLNYKTIATILHRLADQGKVEYQDTNNRLKYRYKNIEEAETSSLLKIFVSAFGVPGLTHLVDKSKNLSPEQIDDLTLEEN